MDRFSIGRTSIGRHAPWLATGDFDWPPQGAPRRVLVALRPKHRREEFAVPVDRSIEVAPAPGDLDVCVVEIRGDALASSQSAQAGDAVRGAKTRTGAVEAMRDLRVARRSAVHGRTTASNQMGALLVRGPSDLREQLRGITVSKLVTTAARIRPADPPPLSVPLSSGSANCPDGC